MPLESATTIADLDESWPLGGDVTTQGDDHLRLLKQVLKDQFPGELGDGYNEVIFTTETELNYSVGLTSNIQEQFDAIGDRLDGLEGTLSAPQGTRMTFNQTAPPTGWTQDVTEDNRMMRLVSSASADVGGTDSPILNDKVPAHNHPASVTDPGHVHKQSWNFQTGLDFDSFGQGARTTASGVNTAASVTGITVAVENNAGANWEPKYIDMIIGVKD